MKVAALRLAVCFMGVLPAVAFADTESDARALVEAWVKAQNDDDFAAYAALYDAKFVGIRRTRDGRETKLKLARWKQYRRKMFDLGQEVAAENVTVTPTKGGATLTFLQRWRGGSYADHGTKVIALRANKKGVLKIVREELLSSTPGWESDPKAVLDATALVSPITVRVQGEGIGEHGCYGARLVLYLKDKKGSAVSRELGGASLDVEGPTTARIDPSTEGDGLLFEMGDYCAGGADYYQIKHSGDALIVLHREYVEVTEEGDDTPASVFEPILTVQLPHGAKVNAKP